MEVPSSSRASTSSHQVVVIFEVIPKSGARADYFDLAAELLPELEKIDGFISVERFESVSQPGKLLSLSVWRDEAAVQNWRENLSHRTAQQKGRYELFQDYRLRVADVHRDYGKSDRNEAPED